MVNKKYLAAIGIIIIIIAVAVLFAGKRGAGKYDSFAKCLTEKGVKMYGAYWCGHCQNQKEMFGSSFQYVDYKECAVQNDRYKVTEVCEKAGIKSYPTWEFPDGAKRTGEIPLDDLAKSSGCELPSDSNAAK